MSKFGIAKRSPMVGGRVQLADLCNNYNFQVAVEVGTDLGLFAREFLRRWRGRILYCIDPYTPYPMRGDDRTPHMLTATLNLQPFSERYILLLESSPQVAPRFKSLGVEFVYIDGKHDYESVKADIEGWWPILAKGGVLAGHDFNNPDVEKAVMELAVREEVNIWFTTDYNKNPSWFTTRKKACTSEKP